MRLNPNIGGKTSSGSRHAKNSQEQVKVAPCIPPGGQIHSSGHSTNLLFLTGRLSIYKSWPKIWRRVGISLSELLKAVRNFSIILGVSEALILLLACAIDISLTAVVNESNPFSLTLMPNFFAKPE